MDTSIPQYQSDFQIRSTFWLSLTAGSLLLPFAIYHLLHQNWGMGVGCMAISMVQILTAWFCHHGRYRSVYMFATLTPFAIMFLAYAFYTIGMSATYWSYPTVLIFYFILSEREAWISNIAFVLIILPLAWDILEPHQAIRLSVTLILVSAYAAIFLRVILKQYSRLNEQAITDNLTGLYNRFLLQDSLEQAIHQNSRTETEMTLITIDIDHFKMINDDLGHDVGDQVLKSLGEFLKTYFRESDKVFRIGGEEFLVLIYNTDESSSLTMAEKLRTDIEQLSLLPDRKVTVSIGVAGLQPGINWKQWMKVCDKHLYEAKNAGRNRVVA